MEIGSNEAIKQAVAGEMGVAIISQHALAMRPDEEGLTVLRVAGFPIHSNWLIIHRQGKRLSPIASVFLTHLEQAGKELRRKAKLTRD